MVARPTGRNWVRADRLMAVQGVFVPRWNPVGHGNHTFGAQQAHTNLPARRGPDTRPPALPARRGPATPTGALRLPGTGTHPRHINCWCAVADRFRHGVLITTATGTARVDGSDRQAWLAEGRSVRIVSGRSSVVHDLPARRGLDISCASGSPAAPRRGSESRAGIQILASA
jgi:hypothetical protein